MLWIIISMITMVILATKTWIETFIHLNNPALLKTELSTSTIYNTVIEYILFQGIIVIFYINIIMQQLHIFQIHMNSKLANHLLQHILQHIMETVKKD